MESSIEKAARVHAEITEFEAERMKESRKAHQERRKLGLPNPDDLFSVPPERIEVSGDDEDYENDLNAFYGKVRLVEKDNPGIKLSKYLEDLTMVKNPSSREKLENYSSMSTTELLGKLNSISPHSYTNPDRIEFYICNILLSMRGVAPRWRKMHPPAAIDGVLWKDEATKFNRDVQIFDLEWIRRKYPKHRPSSRFENLFLHVMKSQEFDYSHASRVASAIFTAEKKASFMSMTFDMQLETVVIKSKGMKNKLVTKLRHMEEVRLDLINAANKNRNRGSKLIKYLDDRLDVWLSAALSESRSPSAMVDVYKMMTGKTITTHSYMKKLKSNNEALTEVGSKFLIDIT